MTTTARPDAADALPPAPPSPAPAAGGRPRHRLRLLAVVVVIGAAVAFLLAEGLSNSLDYFDTVPQALAQRATLGTSTTFRLEGLVVPGSIRRTAQGTDFTVSGGGRRIAVDNVGTPPALFQPDIPVVAVGHFVAAPGADGAGPGVAAVFASDQILVKHTSSYIAAHPSRVRAPNGSSR